jgi:hypothetical protein
MQKPLQRSVYNPGTHRGTQPIRVLQFNLTDQFGQTNPQFAALTEQVKATLGFSPGIQYHIGNNAILSSDGFNDTHTPYLMSGRIIHIHESFLTYVWCVSYALVTLFEEQVAKPDQNRLAGRQVHTPNQAWIGYSFELMRYAQSLFKTFTPWNKAMPNPEQFDFANKAWIEKINGIYLFAMNFILQHEFGHAQSQHRIKKAEARKRKASPEEYQALSRECEREADKLAIEALKLGHTTISVYGRTMSTQLSSDIGNLVGLCCLLFFNKSAKTESTHPSTAERLNSFMQAAAPAPDSSLWGIACVALLLWGRQYQHDFALPTELDGYQDLYYLMLAKAQVL